MRWLLRGALLAAVLVPVLGLGAAWLAFQDRVLVPPGAELDAEDLVRARAVFRDHDPRRLKPGALRAITLTQREVELLAGYAASRLAGGGHGAARVRLATGTASAQLSIEAPWSPFGRFVNVTASLRQGDDLPRFESLRVGALPVPAWLADLALLRGLAWLNRTGDGSVAPDVVQGVAFGNGRVQVAYRWRGDLPDRLRALAIGAEERERLRAHHSRLLERLAALPDDRPESLVAVLAPMTLYARDRHGDAAAEMRAALIVLAGYVTGRGVTALLPEAAHWPRAPLRTLTLAGREDYSQHFVVSAAIAATGGGPLADAIGLYKEVADGRGGSGFSFSDLAADRAGTRYGEVAMRAPQRLHSAAAAGLREADLVPSFAGLPEFLPEAEFKRRYGGIGAPAYQRVMADIETRLAALPLLR